MANEDQVARLRQGVETWNTWREQHPDEQIDLSNAKLRDMDLRGADLYDVKSHVIELHGVNLQHVDLFGVDLSFADLYAANLGDSLLHGANLRGANLSYATLNSADLRDADMSGANLCGANLGYANLFGANLHATNLDQASLNSTVFVKNDLRNVRGLQTLIHYGPSSVDLKSVLLPEGDAMIAFLRGTGFPDAFIEYLPSLLEAHPIQYFSTFISYAHDDDAFAHRLFNDLQNNGVRCWFAPHHMKIGDEIRTRIDASIHTHDRLLLVLSEHSICSHWVKHEVETAFEKEQRIQCQVLFPITLDTTIEQTTLAWAATIRRERHIGDFTHWQDNEDAYQAAFQRVLRDLKRDMPVSKL